jgi:hypothetical protein
MKQQIFTKKQQLYLRKIIKKKGIKCNFQDSLDKMIPILIKK